jgi:hypothetical protein
MIDLADLLPAGAPNWDPIPVGTYALDQCPHCRANVTSFRNLDRLPPPGRTAIACCDVCGELFGVSLADPGEPGRVQCGRFGREWFYANFSEGDRERCRAAQVDVWTRKGLLT